MDLTIGKTLEYSVLGIAIVFALIIVLMIVVKIMSALIRGAAAGLAKEKGGRGLQEISKAPERPVVGGPASGASLQTASGKEECPVGPGAAGQVCLYDVPDREAAMIMAIVADHLQLPLNQLRFQSIKEVREDEV